MRYQIDIPKPSAKRLEKNRTLLVKLNSGWFGGRVIATATIPEGLDSVEFDFDKEIQHRDPNVLDADYYHEFVVLYENSTGSRKEEAKVTPVKIPLATTPHTDHQEDHVEALSLEQNTPT